MFNGFKLWLSNHALHVGVEDHILYLAGLVGVIIIVLLVLIMIRIIKDIRIMKQRQRNKVIDVARKFTKMDEKSKKGPPKLEF